MDRNPRDAALGGDELHELRLRRSLLAELEPKIRREARKLPGAKTPLVDVALAAEVHLLVGGAHERARL